MAGYLQGGLRQKYIIAKTSGREVDPKADYFVLRLDKDPHAINAILRYAHSIRDDNPEFALDLFAKAEEYMDGLTNVDRLVQNNLRLEQERDKLMKYYIDHKLGTLTQKGT